MIYIDYYYLYVNADFLRNMETEQILKMPFDQLGFNNNFCNSCKLMGFNNLEDIFRVTPKQLVSKKGFSYTWLGELSGYLDKKGLLSLLQSGR